MARLITATGGGWGNPYERPVEAVQEDVKNGYLTVRMAEKDYSVIIDPHTFEVTRVTKERRSARKRITSAPAGFAIRRASGWITKSSRSKEILKTSEVWWERT